MQRTYLGLVNTNISPLLTNSHLFLCKKINHGGSFAQSAHLEVKSAARPIKLIPQNLIFIVLEANKIALWQLAPSLASHFNIGAIFWLWIFEIKLAPGLYYLRMLAGDGIFDNHDIIAYVSTDFSRIIEELTFFIKFKLYYALQQLIGTLDKVGSQRNGILWAVAQFFTVFLRRWQSL